MSIPRTLLNQIKCCSSNDGHIVIEPVLLKCGANVCQQCVEKSNKTTFKCYSCNSMHRMKDLLGSPKNTIVETMVQTFLNDLFQHIEAIYRETWNSLKENSLIEEINNKIKEIEIDMNTRVDSLVKAIHEYRDECRLELITISVYQLIRTINKNDTLKRRETGKSFEDFKLMQNDLRECQAKLKHFRMTINELHFVPSTYVIDKEEFGEIKNKKCWLLNSLILNENECLSLAEMTKSSNGELLYRATKDGFTAQAFHSKCDEIPHTITIIKNDLDCVFGGYSSESWKSKNRDCDDEDENAFIFSLRRNGKSKSKRFEKKFDGYTGIYSQSNDGPIFGGGCDIYICNESNVNYGSYCNFGHSYELPEGYKFEQKNTQDYLAGNYDQWLAVEIEVYQII